MTLTRKQKKQLIESVGFWYHTIDIGDGLSTPGLPRLRAFNKTMLDFLPASFAGLSVLDVGCWDGLFSFEAERRGAARVLGIDKLSAGDDFEQGDLPEIKGEGFRPLETVRTLLDSRIEYRQGSVYDLSVEDPGPFDCTIFYGVLYHLWHPMLALERLRRVTTRALFLETHVNEAIDQSVPLIQFYPRCEKYERSTWVGPNALALFEMLGVLGFKRVSIFRFREHPERALGMALLDEDGFRDAEQRARSDPRLELAWSTPCRGSPLAMTEYVYQPGRRGGDFEACALDLERSHRVERAWVDNTPPTVVAACTARLQVLGLRVRELRVDPVRFDEYRRAAGYEERYPDYYRALLAEKAFEHYLSLLLLEVTDRDVVIDLASDGSPVREIYSRLRRCRAYQQDIMYPPGVNGYQIGGDACAMPVPAEFADKALLTCSLEHFEGDGDTRLFRELCRVLKPGGRVCVVPFYVHEAAVNQTDPTVSLPNGVVFDPGVVVYCAKGWGNRFGRFYSPESFVDRVVNPVAGGLEFEVVRITNAPDVDKSLYSRFALLAAKPARS